jgi:hypothetical protein
MVGQAPPYDFSFYQRPSERILRCFLLGKRVRSSSMKKGKLSRRDFIRGSSLAAAATITKAVISGPRIANGNGATTEAPVSASAIQAIIQKAGNADSDELCLDYLKQLKNQPGPEASLKSDLGKLIAQIDRWLHEDRLDYFGREVRNKKDFDFGIPESCALYPLTWLYRGRMVTWYALESGGIWSIPDKRHDAFAVARGFF